MRLPQPSVLRFPATIVSAVVLSMVAAMLPAPMRAATPQLTSSPVNLRYGSVAVGHSKAMMVVLTNNGTTSITISAVTSSKSEFKASSLQVPKSLAAGASLGVTLTFSPKATGSVDGKVTFTSNATNPLLDVGVGGAGVTSEAVKATPASLAFGIVAVGANSTRPLVLTNTLTSTVTLSNVQIANAAFSVSGATFPLNLAAGQSVRLNATFTPQVTGPAAGSALVAGPALSIPFSGTGSKASPPKLTIAPTTLSFGNVTVGATETLTLGLQATGGSVTVSSATSSDAQFTVSGLSFPLTIASGQEASLNVKFTPKKNGKTSATLSFLNNTTESPKTEAMSGTGTAVSVSLSWVASTSPGITGYNIYRSTSKTGTPAKINSSLDADTSYTDASVTSGATYYYVTTAVNSSGVESGFSNQVKAVVP